ncbi:bestrophin family protein [Novosphingobium sp. Fuku2-ISO-50]|uniref:bestrophin family protein n=1 Tax=Novosphingobium sp. Fuku2-ISO-50 TaxID=1739114 RepID=UPI00076CB862|nr:bestrophin family protein [Novosphingobium sp. Fuku2-ISO-50]KUR78440.1 bestrophin [Novosphingobium sp. Fuku2-ISO-50]
MIVRDKPGLIEVLFALRGTMLPRIVGRLVVIAAVGGAAVFAADLHPGIFARIGAIPFTLIGLALSIFMSFRNNACYDRWWEGRKLWGALIIAARSLARQSQVFDDETRAVLLSGVAAFAAGLAARLRGGDEAAAIAARLPDGLVGDGPNPTDAVLSAMGRTIQRALRAGRIDPLVWARLEDQLVALSQVQAGCERIAATPVPFAYSLLLHRTAHVFCLTLPMALAGTMGWWALVPSLLVGYTFFGLDALGDQLEEPFGLEPNDLPLDAMVRMIEREMLGAAGVTLLPPLLAPVGGVLL